ncbi:MAG TPA: DNA topology modulation protein [Pyrinomonadaceae bacterium]|nr:DNA topology modulation protein [Pyrinomonadaceae bacterium]
MRRIIVIGSSGAGKSTLAQRLGARLGLEVLHLDALHWKAGWVEPPKDVWTRRVEELLRRDSWIIDGNYSGTMQRRLEACDTVVFLDLPRLVCVWRIVKRTLVYFNRNRPDMAEGCYERFDLKFLRWVWDYPKRTRPKVVELLKNAAPDKRVVWLKSSAEVESFIDSLPPRDV